MTGILWIAISYLLGSFPSGYIFSRLSKKNILEIGWRKTSGSNVFRNVGIWQGVATGVLDVLKGYLAVFLAQKLGFSLEIQIFSGVAAVTGHNWSVFLKFAGGRGIGTFIGALFAISPLILGYSIIPLIILAVVWDAAIGTLLFLAIAIYLSIYFNQLATAGLFTIFNLAPILIKRLSPLAEIKKAENKWALFRNRILFDDDQAHLELRIKRIFKKIKKNSNQAAKIIKPLPSQILQRKTWKGLAAPLFYPPKVGWKAAKYGVKIAKKPLERVFGTQEKVVKEISAEDFKKMMIASTKKIVLHQEEINKINVFPVADKDTGYNLAATLLGIESVISRKSYSTLREIAKDIRDSAMINARGNAGMIFAGYLMEILDRVKHLETIDAAHFGLALKKGIKAARASIAEPVDGTILDVIKATGEKFFEIAELKKEKNIIKILEKAYQASEVALRETKEKLEVLKQNDVVDAGALGFVKILEAWIESLKGEPLKIEKSEKPSVFEARVEEESKYKKEVVFSLKKSKALDSQELKKELLALGESIDVIATEDKIKFHIHTGSPEIIKEKIQGFEILDWRVENIVGEAAKITKKQPLGLVVGETAGLPKDFVEKHQIEVVPFKINFPEVEPIWKSSVSFYEKLKKAKKLPTTSAAAFGDYFDHYKKALEKFEKILVITLSSRLSGAYSQARIARSIFKKPEKLNVYVFDCFAVEVAEGLITLRAQELISQGKTTKEVVEYLKKFCPKVKLLGCFENIKYAIEGGRIKLPKILIPLNIFAQKLGIQPLFELREGKIKLFGIRAGKDIAKILAKEIEKERKQKPIRVAISQADNSKVAQALKEELEKKPDVKVVFISSVSPVIGIHAGPGAILVAYHPLTL